MYVTANDDSNEQDSNPCNIDETIRCGCVIIEGIDSEELTTVVKLWNREDVQPLKILRFRRCDYGQKLVQ